MAKKNQKLWGGRFKQKTLSEVDTFNASVQFDYKLYPFDIAGSIAHARMLGKTGILKKSEAAKLVRGLQKTMKDIDAGKFRWDPAKEDVHLNVESYLTQKIGPLGGKLHTGRSRNDQVATDFRLYCRAKVLNLIVGLKAFQKALLGQAERNVDVLLPGYTHMQRAQPISLGHYFLAYFEMFQRDVERLVDSLPRINVSPLGAGALAGTTFPIDRGMVARELGFDSLARNSLDAVSDRDFVLETLANLSVIMMHLSRLAEEWILWATQEFQYIILPESYCTGSSMMPQKINPDVLELVRGKTGRVYGALVSLLTTMKGLPLAYNKDMQEDKEPLMDAVETVANSLKLLTSMVDETRFHEKNMEKALAEGFVLATDLADYLATKGVPFREAHRIVGKMIAHCQELHIDLRDLPLKAMKKFHPAIKDDVFDWLSFDYSVDRRASLGGTSRSNVRREIKLAWRRLKG